VDAFDVEDFSLLQAVANQLAIALENARLFEETQQRLGELQRLHQASQTVNADLSFDAVLNSVADHFIAALEVETCTISGWDAARGEFVTLIDRDPEPTLRVTRGTRERAADFPDLQILSTEGRTQTYRRDDPSLSDETRAMLDPFQWQSLLEVPLLAKGRLIGVVELGERRRARDYGPHEIRLAESLANQAATAIENARLFEAQRRRAEEMAALAEMSRAITENLGLQETLDRIINSACQIIPASGCSVSLVDGLSGDMVVQASTNGETGVRISAAVPSAIGWVARTKQLLAEEDVSANPIFNQELNRRYGIQSALVAPIIYKDTGIGALGLSASSRRVFSEGEKSLVQAIADQAAIAIENARLFEETRQRLAELEAVNRVSSALRAARTLDEMLPVLLDETLAVLNTTAGSILLYDPERQQLSGSVSRGWFVQVDESPMQPREGIGGHVLATGQVYVSHEFASDPLTRESVRPQVPAGWGGACLPIRTGQQVVGVLSVAVPLPRELTPAEMHLLTTLAEIAGNAIHRTRLNEQTERHLQRVQALHTIDQAISGSLDLQVNLDVILGQIIEQLGVHAADILLLNPQTLTLEYAVGRGLRTTALRHMHLRLGEGPAGRVALERRMVEIRDWRLEIGNWKLEVEERSTLQSFGYAQDRPPTSNLQLSISNLRAEGFVAYYGVPLVAKGQTKGVLEVFHRAALYPDAEWLEFLEALAEQAAIAIDNAALFAGLQRSNFELARAYDATLEGWARALDLREKETEGHTQHVAEIAVRLARALGMSEAELVHVQRGALLHDIGLISISDEILRKPGALTEAEWQVMRQHPLTAYEMLAPIAYLHPALDIPHCHHEKWDGSGYPRGLKGEQIPLAARIFAVVDVWDALRSARPYRAAWGEAQARECLREQAGKHFDPRVVAAFLEMMEEE
jgi:HD-GYP domain-containing protein (c-di-GMP phosphodiesterase class II)/putative methionine-R-sulfoxide reductase with GAF domain